VTNAVLLYHKQTSQCFRLLDNCSPIGSWFALYHSIWYSHCSQINVHTHGSRAFVSGNRKRACSGFAWKPGLKALLLVVKKHCQVASRNAMDTNCADTINCGCAFIPQGTPSTYLLSPNRLQRVVASCGQLWVEKIVPEVTRCSKPGVSARCMGLNFRKDVEIAD